MAFERFFDGGNLGLSSDLNSFWAGLFQSTRLMPWKWAIGTVGDGKDAVPDEAVCLVSQTISHN